MSGLPHGPYTVKNLKPVQGNLNICEYEWAIASFDFFDAAYRLTGWSTLFVSEKGKTLFNP